MWRCRWHRGAYLCDRQLEQTNALLSYKISIIHQKNMVLTPPPILWAMLYFLKDVRAPEQHHDNSNSCRPTQVRKKNDCGKDMQMKECLKFLSEREQPDSARDRGVPSKQACHTYPSCERRRRGGHPRCGRHTDVFCHECLRVRTSDALPSRSDLRVCSFPVPDRLLQSLRDSFHRRPPRIE